MMPHLRHVPHLRHEGNHWWVEYTNEPPIGRAHSWNRYEVELCVDSIDKTLWNKIFNEQKREFENVNANREQVIRNRIMELEAELNERMRYGRDTYEDGAILAWVKTFPDQPDKTYRYAALKSENRWYVTGARNNGPQTWDLLVAGWTSENVVEVVRVMRTYYAIGTPEEIPAPNVETGDLSTWIAPATPPAEEKKDAA